MKQLQYFPFLLFSIIFSLHCTTTPAQAQPASPGPSGPTNITAILEKAGQFTTFIRLLKSTQVANQINTQLNNSNQAGQGLTVFAPTDNAFSSLKSSTLNSLTDQQKVQLIQFHVLPSFYSISQFQTVSNPLRTQAGDSSNGQFPLNVTTSANQVNITTGVVDATVANTIFTDSQFALYQVDKVLLPLDIFGSTAASPAPAPANKPEKRVSGSDAPSGSKDDASVDASGATTAILSFGVAVSTAAFCSLWL